MEVSFLSLFIYHQYLNSGPSFIHEDDKKKIPPPSCSDIKPQYVHHLALQPPPEISHSISKHEGNSNCVMIITVQFSFKWKIAHKAKLNDHKLKK